MKLLSIENFPLLSVLFLKDTGYDIKHVGTDYRGITDIEVIKLALRQKEQ